MVPEHRTVRDVMTRAVLAISPAESIADALDLAREHSVTHLPVIAGERTVGVVCTCDLEDASLNADVSSVMHTPPASIGPDVPIVDAATTMTKLRVGSLLVISGDYLVGILTRSDIDLAGLAKTAFADQRCTACGTFQHVHLDASKNAWLCASCRRRSCRHVDDNELGTGD